MENNMTCEKCGGAMKKIDNNRMKCDGCGATKNIQDNKTSSPQETKK